MNDRIHKCISCSNSHFKYYTENVSLNLPMYICQNCNLYITGKSQKELDTILLNYYKEDFYNKKRELGLFNDEHNDRYSRGRIRVWNSQFNYLKEFLLKTSKILEIGSGHGESIIEFDKLNYNVVGIEPDEKNVSHLQQILKNCRIINSTAEEFQVNEKFDLVWMSHVFEHLSRPVDFLKKLKQNLKKDGVCFIEVPNVEKKNDYRTFTKTPHAYNYSEKSLNNIIEKNGYEVIKCDFFGAPNKINGGINKISQKILKKNFYQYYPKMLTSRKNGEDIRIVFRLK